MDKTSITILICMAGEVMLLSTAVTGYRRKGWENSIQKFSDYFGVFIGTPLFIFTIYAFFKTL
ncbi:hypothetical protein [Emergencia sp.]|uniref:hypothetical protein n=1 Tax=Emergencia sp. TaxID=1926557 RepID=UPI003AF09F93